MCTIWAVVSFLQNRLGSFVHFWTKAIILLTPTNDVLNQIRKITRQNLQNRVLIVWWPELLNKFTRIKSWYFRVFEISFITRHNEIDRVPLSGSRQPA